VYRPILRLCEQVSLVTYADSAATVQVSFSNYTTEDGVTAALDLVPFTPAVNPELYWGLQALNSALFRGPDPSRADARLVRTTFAAQNNTSSAYFCILRVFVYLCVLTTV